ncbi:tapasin-related protein-like isoform X2 [Tachysurus vachellii]|uniref:tapasin-related protein-like isoform X2 n=1 Tax=Tachysurus vachellii TaxID=175792 RepID=UPI00296B5131|nr:tapasin-related protein-like isoform X2 [Tachysurus vachellii]
MQTTIFWLTLSSITILNHFSNSLSAVKTWTCRNFNSTQVVRQGSSTSINCYQKQNFCLRDKGVAFAVDLRRKHLLCAYFYINQSWNKQSCNDNIRFVWIPETEQISFDLLNIQINHSADYTCTVIQYFPPPTHCVLIQRTLIQVIASPSVSVACVKEPDGTPTMLCATEGFYPADLKQAWLRDGEYISYLNTSLQRPNYDENLSTSHINWTFKNNTDGSYSLMSYLHLSSNIAEQVMYFCWVNHSTLIEPITVIMSSDECTETEAEFTGIFVRCIVVGPIFGLLICTALFIEIYFQHLNKSRQTSL